MKASRVITMDFLNPSWLEVDNKTMKRTIKDVRGVSKRVVQVNHRLITTEFVLS